MSALRLSERLGNAGLCLTLSSMFPPPQVSVIEFNSRS